MPSRSIIRTGVGPHREPGNRFPAMAAINLLAARAARVQSRRNLSRSLSPKLDHSHSITRFDRSRTGPNPTPNGDDPQARQGVRVAKGFREADALFSDNLARLSTSSFSRLWTFAPMWRGSPKGEDREEGSS